MAYVKVLHIDQKTLEELFLDLGKELLGDPRKWTDEDVARLREIFKDKKEAAQWLKSKVVMLYDTLVDEFDVDGITNVRVEVFDSGEAFYEAFKGEILSLITSLFYEIYHTHYRR
jgi:hypothetical protein